MQELVRQNALGQDQIVFYGLCFLLGSAAGLVRTARDNDYLNLWNLINISMVSGFLSFSVISVYVYWSGGLPGNEFYFLGISSFIGLLGKDLQEKVIANLFNYISSKFKIFAPKELSC